MFTGTSCKSQRSKKAIIDAALRVQNYILISIAVSSGSLGGSPRFPKRHSTSSEKSSQILNRAQKRSMESLHAFGISDASFLHDLTLFIGINIMAARTYREVVRKGNIRFTLRGENVARRDLRGKSFSDTIYWKNCPLISALFLPESNLFHLRTRDVTSPGKKGAQNTLSIRRTDATMTLVNANLSFLN